MTNPEQVADEVRCQGSGLWPAEPVLLDTTWGAIAGTCTRCRRVMTLDGYRLPEHSDGEAS